MPERLYLFTDQGNIGPVDHPERACVSGERLILRPLSVFDGTTYDRNGNRLPAIVELPELRADGIAETYGFWAELEPHQGSVVFQVSNDGGTTWLRWNGSLWVADSLWSTREDMDAGFPSLPLPSPKRILVRIQITPSSNGKRGPSIKSVSVFYELAYQWEEDLLRSLKHFLEDSFAFTAIATENLQAAPSIDIDANATPSAVLSAYNLTTDPKKQANVFSGLSGQTISFLAPQTGVVEVTFKAVPRIFISANVSLEQSTSLAVLLEVLSSSENKTVRTHAPKIDWHRAANEVRTRPPPVWDDVQVRIQAQSPTKREAEAMVEAIAEVLQYDVTFYSDATGEEIIIKALSDITLADVVGDGLYVKQAVLSMTGRHWLKVPYETVGLAQTLILQAAPRTAKSDDHRRAPSSGIEVLEFEDHDHLVAPAGPGTKLLSGRAWFSYNTTSPLVLFALQPDDIIDVVSVVVTEAFDDSATVIQVGTIAMPELVFAAGIIGTGRAPAQFDNRSKLEIGLADSLALTISPGTSTHGEGFVVFTVRR